jgi:hypothetical protein
VCPETHNRYYLALYRKTLDLTHRAWLISSPSELNKADPEPKDTVGDTGFLGIFCSSYIFKVAK